MIKKNIFELHLGVMKLNGVLWNSKFSVNIRYKEFNGDSVMKNNISTYKYFSVYICYDLFMSYSNNSVIGIKFIYLYDIICRRFGIIKQRLPI